jgi:nitrite reductase/ring-hydroxylating ferredoxin subunit
MRVLCRLEDIADGAAKGFSLADGAIDIFVVRKQRQVFAYRNSCPHIGTPLEFLPDRFLTRDRAEILCSTHGARFEIATGRCVAGPCAGRFLVRAPVEVESGNLVLRESPAATPVD